MNDSKKMPASVPRQPSPEAIEMAARMMAVELVRRRQKAQQGPVATLPTQEHGQHNGKA